MNINSNYCFVFLGMDDRDCGRWVFTQSREGEVDWKAQHERRVAERREKTEHERIEAEKLQQVMGRERENDK